jgi:post-segregation antitoxin (ccd killing protein)
MKRTNVIVDEELLEKARRATGEKTYSATINKALEDVVRKHDFWAAYDEWEKEVKKGDFFWPGYLKEIRPNAIIPETVGKRRLSAHDARAPKKTTTRARRPR